MNVRHLALLGTIGLGAFGCTSTDYYKAAPTANAQTAATVAAGQTPLLGFARVVRAGITRVDDKAAPAASFERPFLIAPGRHRIVITAQMGAETVAATTDYVFEAGRSYIARATDIRDGAAEVWLEDEKSGQPGGNKFRATTAVSVPAPR